MLTPAHHQKNPQYIHEHQNWTMKQCKKATWSDELYFLLHHVDSWCHFFGEKIALKEEGKPVLAMRCSEQWSAGKLWVIQHIVADQVQSFMTLVFLNDRHLLQQDTASCCTAKNVQKWYEEHDSFDLTSKFPRSQSNLASVGCARQTTPIYGDPTSQLTRLKGSDGNTLGPDTTAHLQKSCGDYASMSCFGGTHTILDFNVI